MDTLASLMEVKLDIREKRTEIPLRVGNDLIGHVMIGINYFYSYSTMYRHGRGVTLKSRQSNPSRAT